MAAKSSSSNLNFLPYAQGGSLPDRIDYDPEEAEPVIVVCSKHMLMCGNAIVALQTYGTRLFHSSLEQECTYA